MTRKIFVKEDLPTLVKLQKLEISRIRIKITQYFLQNLNIRLEKLNVNNELNFRYADDLFSKKQRQYASNLYYNCLELRDINFTYNIIIYLSEDDLLRIFNTQRLNMTLDSIIKNKIKHFENQISVRGDMNFKQFVFMFNTYLDTKMLNNTLKNLEKSKVADKKERSFV